MANKRFGPTDSKGRKPVDVNLDVFAGVKSRDELKAEKGKIFAHLGSAAQDAAYEELADALGLPKAVAPTKAADPAPAAAQAASTPAVKPAVATS